MYFSAHCVTHVDSLLETEAPGFGMHFSKQFSFIFWVHNQSWNLGKRKSRGEGTSRTNLDELPRIGHVGLGQNLLDDRLLY
jgi:hypothetical protein